MKKFFKYLLYGHNDSISKSILLLLEKDNWVYNNYTDRLEMPIDSYSDSSLRPLLNGLSQNNIIETKQIVDVHWQVNSLRDCLAIWLD